MNDNSHITDLILLPVLACIWILYDPALSSGFFLDDYPNLFHLADIRQDGFSYYIFSGVSSYLGRPLSLLSFAVQYENWPANPYAFKSVNLFIHLFNGVLVFFVARYLANHLKFSRKEVALISYSVVLLWLLHPIQLSTTLYVVQRMTLLSTLFTLGGILFYFYCRPMFKTSLQLPRAVSTGLVIWIFLLLAVLSKENGILFPLYLLILETTILREERYSNAWKVWLCVILILPLLLLCFYLMDNLHSILESYRLRPYTVHDRLLTQAVVVSDYFFKILMPHPSTFSIYNEDYPVSTGVFQPLRTFWSLFFIGLLLVSGLLFNKRWPVLSFGIFWFLGGHLLESTFLNLELYFEHRNYLPALGIFFVLGWAMVIVSRAAHLRIVIVLMVVYQLLVFSVTLMEIRLWANPLEQAIAWAQAHPGSPRALENLGSQYIKGGSNIPEAITVYTQMTRQYPDQIYPHLKIIALRACANDEVVQDDTWDELLHKATHAARDRFNIVAEIHIISIAIHAGDCPNLGAEKVQNLIAGLAANPAFQPLKVYLYEEASLLSLYSGDIYNALYHVQQAINISADLSRLIYKAELLITTGDIKEAMNTFLLIDKKMGNYKNWMAYHKSVSRLKDKLQALEKNK